MIDEYDKAVADLQFGYQLGHADGYADGRTDTQAEYAADWEPVAARIRAGAMSPTQAELEQRRQPDHQPCQMRCRRCSRCVHSLSYYGRGGRDYLGQEREAEIARGAA